MSGPDAAEPDLVQPPGADRPRAAVHAEALASGHLSGDGAFTVRCHEALETITGASRVLLTTSCTHALEMAALLLDSAPATR